MHGDEELLYSKHGLMGLGADDELPGVHGEYLENHEEHRQNDDDPPEVWFYCFHGGDSHPDGRSRTFNAGGLAGMECCPLRSSSGACSGPGRACRASLCRLPGEGPQVDNCGQTLDCRRLACVHIVA